MNPPKEEKIEELKKNLLSNQFNIENISSINNSLKIYKTKSADSIYKNDSFSSNPKGLYHNIYFALLYLISIFIVGISCAYYFSYNNYNNRIFLSTIKKIVKEQYPFYKIVSKYTKGNFIYVKLQLEELPSNNNNENIENNNLEELRNLDVIFEFFYDSVNFKIFSSESKSNLEEKNIYNLNDIDYSNKKINNYKDSNINITFSHYPFNFYLQRKDDGAILFDSDCGSSSSFSQNQLSFAKNNIQICTKIDEESYFFGLGDDAINRGLNLLIGKGQKFNLYSNNSDVMPFILSYNKYNLTSSGILMLNSGPIKIKVLMDQISINYISGIINIHILGGPSVKEVILQTQNTLGLPLIPYYHCIDWDFFDKNTFNVNINNNINLDDIYYNNISLHNFFNIEKANFTDIIKENIDNKNIIISLDSKVYSKELDDSNYMNLLFLHEDNEKLIKNNYLLDNLNTIGLQEVKYYNDFIYHQLPSKSRLLLFSSRAFIDSNTLSYKIIKDIPFSLEGIRVAINKLKSQSLFGNAFCFIQFDEKSLIKNKTNEEIFLRWTQFMSMLPFASLNNINTDIEIPLYIKNFRYIFSLYIYLYFIVISTEGGSFFRPLFYDLKSKSINEDLISKRYEIMLGSNLLIEPIFIENLTNITTLFPEEKFYDFYKGNYINDKGEGYYNFICDKNKLPIFLRGGKVTPVQLLDEYYDIYIGNTKNNNFIKDDMLTTEKMKEKPIQLLIALDNNMQAQGRILLDDFVSNDSKKKKIFYKMVITVSQRTNDISIFFRVYSFKYNLPIDLFKNCINRLIIYGFTKLSIKKITIMNKNGRVELDRSKLIFSQSSDVLTIPNINVPLNMDTKILII